MGNSTYPPLSYDQLVSHLDANVEGLLPNQVLDTGHPEFGGFVGAQDGMAGGSHFGCVQTIGFAWLSKGSRYYGDPVILDRLRASVGFARSIRRPSGRYDLITTNWDCGPYTAFVAQALAPLVAAARKSTQAGADEIAEE